MLSRATTSRARPTGDGVLSRVTLAGTVSYGTIGFGLVLGPSQALEVLAVISSDSYIRPQEARM